MTAGAPRRLPARRRARLGRRRWSGELPAAVRLRHELHARPELSGHEDGTAERVVAARSARTHRGPARRCPLVAGTGRLVRIGPAAGPAVAVRAELDALPIDEQHRRRLGLRGARGDARLRPRRAPGRGGGAGRRAACTGRAGCRPRCCWCCSPARSCRRPERGTWWTPGCWREHRVASMIGVHVQPQVAAGQLAVDPGVVNAGVDEFTITISGRGGHSAYPHLALDPVPALCQSVLAARDAASVVDPMRPVVVTVGMLEAGRAPNVIGEVARAQGTLRTIDPADRKRLHDRLRAVVTGTAAAFGCTGSSPSGPASRRCATTPRWSPRCGPGWPAAGAAAGGRVPVLRLGRLRRLRRGAAQRDDVPRGGRRIADAARPAIPAAGPAGRRGGRRDAGRLPRRCRHPPGMARGGGAGGVSRREGRAAAHRGRRWPPRRRAPGRAARGRP